VTTVSLSAFERPFRLRQFTERRTNPRLSESARPAIKPDIRVRGALACSGLSLPAGDAPVHFVAEAVANHLDVERLWFDQLLWYAPVPPAKRKSGTSKPRTKPGATRGAGPRRRWSTFKDTPAE